MIMGSFRLQITFVYAKMYLSLDWSDPQPHKLPPVSCQSQEAGGDLLPGGNDGLSRIYRHKKNCKCFSW
jgi:hypothetical protein